MGKSRYTAKHVLITGGSEGLGLDIARLFVQRGAHVTVVSRSQAKLDAALEQLREAAGQHDPSPKVFAVSADVTDEKQIQGAVQKAEVHTGPVDVLVCNAGLSTPGLFLEQPVSISSRTMDLNYFGSLNAVKAVVDGMVSRRSGRIVLIASALALLGYGGYSSYAPSKWALRGLADCLHNELQGTGVGVSIAYPPDMVTPGFSKENETKVRIRWDGGSVTPGFSEENETKVRIRWDEGSITPGFSKKNETKVELTNKVDEALGAEVFPSMRVAQCILRGLERGAYHLPSPDFGQNMLISLQNGISPGFYPLPVRMLLAPILALVAAFLSWRIDRVAAKYAGQRKPRSTSTDGSSVH